jgi:hypothetical protein
MFNIIFFHFDFNFNLNLNLNFSKTSSSSQVNLSWEASHTFDMINVDQYRFEWYRLEVEMWCSILLDINSRSWLNIAQKCVNELENTIKSCLTIYLKFVFFIDVRLHFLYSNWCYSFALFVFDLIISCFNISARKICENWNIEQRRASM